MLHRTDLISEAIRDVKQTKIPLAVYAHQNKAVIMTQNGLKYDHKSAK